MENLAAFQVGAMAFIAALIEVVPSLQAWWNEKFNSAQKLAIIWGLVLVLAILSIGYNCRYNAVCPVSWEKTVVDLVIAIFAGAGGALVGHKAKYLNKAS